MKSDVGLILRLTGPLIQVVCLILLFSLADRHMELAGVRVDYVLYAGFALGLVMVLAGLALSRPGPRRPRRDDDL